MSDAANYRIELEVYEGPLDLLLHLVRKHELSILDIPVSFVTEKYLEYLELLRHLNLEVAGEYLLMAATLAQIKSHELLPTPDPEQMEGDDEEEGDPRQELIRRLLEYQKYKEAAVHLSQRPVVGRNVWTRGAPVDDVLPDDIDRKADRPLKEVPVFALIEALNRVLERARVRMSHEVVVERLRVTDRINELVDRLAQDSSFSFASCFAFLVNDEEVTAADLKHQVVVTFLAVLEMCKLNLIRVAQLADSDEIMLMRAGPIDIDQDNVGVLT